MTLECDVAIVGGGPAGATVARLLAGWGYRTIVADSALGPGSKVGEVLAPCSRMILEKLRLVEELDQDRALARRCLGIVSDWGGPHRRDYLREPGGRGWIVDRAEFERRLAAKAMSAGAAWLWNHRLARAEARGDQVDLSLASTPAVGTSRTLTTVSAAFVVDATGRAAALGRRLGARRRIATRHFGHEEPPDEGASHPSVAGWVTIAAHPDGWSYVANGPGNARHHVRFTNRPQRLAQPRRLPRRVWEAGFSILDPACGERWLAVGDAAAAFDPLTSQGLPQALGSGLAAAHAIRHALAGDPGAVPEYHRAVVRTWRRSLLGSEAVYVRESRWADAPFWKAVHSPS